MNDALIFDVTTDFDRLRGRLFELLEVTGMPDRQQQAAKRLIRSITYDSQAHVVAALRANGTRPPTR